MYTFVCYALPHLQGSFHFSPEQTLELKRRYGAGRAPRIGADTSIAARR
jgi:hypothetical protein